MAITTFHIDNHIVINATANSRVPVNEYMAVTSHKNLFHILTQFMSTITQQVDKQFLINRTIAIILK